MSNDKSKNSEFHSKDFFSFFQAIVYNIPVRILNYILNKLIRIYTSLGIIIKFSFYLINLYVYNQWWGSVFVRKRILIHISCGLDFALIFRKHVLSILKISKTFAFFLRTSGKYLTRYGQGSLFIMDPWKLILKTDPCQCPNLVKDSPDVLKKKTKVLTIFNTDQKCYLKINVESSPQVVLIRIRLLEKTGSQSVSLYIILLPFLGFMVRAPTQ